MGEAVLIVPDDVCVATDARVGMGATSVFDRDQRRRRRRRGARTPTPRAGASRLLVDADIGLGHLDIRKTGPDREYWDDEDNWDEGGCERLDEHRPREQHRLCGVVPTSPRSSPGIALDRVRRGAPRRRGRRVALSFEALAPIVCAVVGAILLAAGLARDT